MFDLLSESDSKEPICFPPILIEGCSNITDQINYEIIHFNNVDFKVPNDTIDYQIEQNEELLNYNCNEGTKKTNYTGKSKEGNKRYEARKLFEIAPPIILGGNHEQSDNIKDVNNNHLEVIDNSKSFKVATNAVTNIFNNFGRKILPAPPKKSGIEYKMFTEKI